MYINVSKVETKLNKVHSNRHAKKQKKGDEIWDELLKSPESKILLAQMAEQAKRDFKDGKFKIGGFDNK